MVRKNLNVVAGKLADYLGLEIADGQSGVLGLYSIGHLLAFARDGAEQIPRSRQALVRMRGGLAYLGLPVLGYGFSIPDGRTWTVIIDADPGDGEALKRVGELLRACRAAAADDEASEFEHRPIQARLALEEIERFRCVFE
jgi:hypothetical protein